MRRETTGTSAFLGMECIVCDDAALTQSMHSTPLGDKPIDNELEILQLERVVELAAVLHRVTGINCDGNIWWKCAAEYQ